MPIAAAQSPRLKTLPVYQPGRPIEEVARELGLPADDIIKLASNENPLGPSPLALAAMQKALAGPESLSRRQRVLPEAKTRGETRRRAGQSDSRQRLERNHRIRRARAASRRARTWSCRNTVLPFIPSSRNCSARTSSPFRRKITATICRRCSGPSRRSTRVVFVANPNNPTGTLAPREELIQFVNDVPDDVLLVMDEAYIEFLDDPLDLVSLVRLGARTESDFDADVLENLRAGRPAHRLRHRASRIDCRAGKNPAAVQHQSARASRRARRAGRRRACPQNAARTISPGWNFSSARSAS